MDKLALAYKVAKKYHAGQKDRAGKDYIYHLKLRTRKTSRMP